MEYLGEALEIAGIGIGVVFFALVILMLVLYALNKFLPPQNASAASADSAPPPPPPPAVAPESPSAPDTTMSDKSRAAAAAVALALASRRRPSASADAPGRATAGTWRSQGNAAQMTARANLQTADKRNWTNPSWRTQVLPEHDTLVATALRRQSGAATQTADTSAAQNRDIAIAAAIAIAQAVADAARPGGALAGATAVNAGLDWQLAGAAATPPTSSGWQNRSWRRGTTN